MSLWTGGSRRRCHFHRPLPWLLQNRVPPAPTGITAKRLGISGGVGDNMFAPEREITRQEMFTLLYNALKVIGRLPETGSGAAGSATAGKALADFSDAGQIASWATEALTLLTKTGTVAGSNGTLTPLSTTTRAEMAQVLYNLLGK